MKGQAIFIIVYAIILFIGGLMGYLKAGSTVSLVMGMVCSIVALTSAILVWQGFKWGRWVAFGLATFLFFFFGYRFLSAYKFFPGGFMSLISLLVASALLLGKRVCQRYCKGTK